MIGAIVQGLGQGAILALMAVGLVLVFKGSKVVNLAQGEIGAFAFFLVFVLTGRGALSGPLFLLLVVAVAALLSIGVERVIMRPLVERPPVQGTIATLGVAIILINIEFLLGQPATSRWSLSFLAEGSSSYPILAPTTVGSFSFSLAGATIVSGRIVALLLTVAVSVGLYFFFKTKFGLGVVAATSDNTVARILGIPVRKVYRFIWGMGGALAGLVTALFAPVLGSFAPADMTFLMIAALAAAVIGGLDSIPGAVAGGFIVALLGAVVGQLFPSAGAVGDLAILIAVVATLMVRPRGLLGGAGVEL